MSRVYTRNEAINLIEELNDLLSNKIAEENIKSFNDTETNETLIYFHNNGNEFISLLEQNDIKTLLEEYDNNTISFILGKLITIATAFSLKKDLSQEFYITENRYKTTTVYNSDWVMQDPDWGDKWRYNSEEKIEELNEVLRNELLKHGFTEEEIPVLMETDDKKKSSIDNLIKNINKKINTNIPNEYEQCISPLQKRIDGIKKDINELAKSSIPDKQERLTRKGAQLIYFNDEIVKLEAEKQKKIDELNYIKDNVLYEKLYKSGCKIVAMAKIFAAMYEDENITPETMIEYLDSNGNLDDKSLQSKYPDYKVTTVTANQIATYDIPENSYIIGKAILGGGLGEHFVVIKKIDINEINGNTVINYDFDRTSKNDSYPDPRDPNKNIKRNYSSEPVTKNEIDKNKGQITELRIFERTEEKWKRNYL